MVRFRLAQKATVIDSNKSTGMRETIQTWQSSIDVHRSEEDNSMLYTLSYFLQCLTVAIKKTIRNTTFHLNVNKDAGIFLFMNNY